MHLPTFWCDGESSFCIVKFGGRIGELNMAWDQFRSGGRVAGLQKQLRLPGEYSPRPAIKFRTRGPAVQRRSVREQAVWTARARSRGYGSWPIWDLEKKKLSSNYGLWGIARLDLSCLLSSVYSQQFHRFLFQVLCQYLVRIWNICQHLLNFSLTDTGRYNYPITNSATNKGPVHLAYNPSYLAYFFSRNSIFLSQKISQQCFSAGL
jgi:hypothetical protein